ncbi:MAG: ABC transporter ATP-binding protein [Candidatus Kapabacteria bacterium]|nr:ABC transporter ATP-binding protein [Ignavibacteriota bacterium]MCW5884496.1 ABC transporter ATP-binding protein [Candidatus Kapabacteria bacterium]
MRGDAFGSEYKSIDYKLIKRLIKFLKPYKKLVFMAVFFTLFVAALGPLRPYLNKVAIDDYISASDNLGLLKMIVIIFVLLVITGALRVGMTYIMQWVGQSVLNDIRTKLFEHIQKLSLSYYDKNPVGRLVTRVTNDVEVLNQLFSSGLVMMLADIMLIFWIVGFMFYTNTELALLALTVLPLLLLVTTFFRKKVRVLFRDLRTEVSKMNTFLNEFISGITTVKLFTQERRLSEDFNQINLRTRELNIRTIFYYAVFYPAVEMISAIALGLILWYAGGNILSGVMTVGMLIAFIQYAEMFFRPVRDLSEKYTTLQNAMASSERIFSLLDTEEFLLDNPDALNIDEIKDNIVFDNVSFTYDDEKWVLKNINFEIKKGETIAIVGATGSGKTSLINLLCRFYDYQKGKILIDGKDIRNITQKSLREKIAIVMQDVFLFSRTVSENISLGNEEIKTDDIRNAAKALGALNFIENLPDKFSTEVSERGQTLSAGQVQLISFCRAYAANPELLILDEATSNIDTETEKLIEKSLEILLKDRTSIVIAHRLSTIQRADRIIVLHKGEIREIGSHEELLAKQGLYSKLYQLQYKETFAA